MGIPNGGGLTDVLQPLDRSVFGALKSEYRHGPEGGQAHDEGRFRVLPDPCVGAGIGPGHRARLGVL